MTQVLLISRLCLIPLTVIFQHDLNSVMFHPIMFKEHRVGLKALVQWVHLKLDNLKSVKEFF